MTCRMPVKYLLDARMTKMQEVLLRHLSRRTKLKLLEDTKA